VSRATPHKRLDLPVRALAEPAARGARLVVGGDGPSRPALETLARELGVSDRVRFLGKIEDAELLEHYARCRAVCFTPWNEDFGFVTAEAFAARKAVITTDDSGGPAELVADGAHGLVTPATPAGVATAMGCLIDDPAAAERMGAAAGVRAEAMSWTETVRRLLVV
jgi:glycosyltransferase involved in cell wall biosynthesis